MDEFGLYLFIRVKRKNFKVVLDNEDKIRDLFGVRLCEKTVGEHHNVSKSGFVLLSVEQDLDFKEEKSSSLIDVTAQLQVCNHFHFRCPV